MERLALHIGDDSTNGALNTIFQEVRRAGGRALFVGGCVRDAILDDQAKDLDIEVYGMTPEALKRLLATRFKTDCVGEAFGIIKIHDLPIDISIPRRESKIGLGHKAFDILSDPTMTPREAAVRRDFTMNAMAYDPVTQELIDPFSGFQDLKDHILRHVGAQFSEDPLRVLRGHQFAGRFSLQATPETLRLCQDLVVEYDVLAIERVWGEWYKWAAQSRLPSAGLKFLQQCQWLRLYPELAALQGCPQDSRYHPEGDVWVHTLHVVDQAARIAERDYLNSEDRVVLVFSALCHDLGKPETTEVLSNRIRSYGHTGTVETFRTFLGQIGMPIGLMNRVMYLCQYHLTHIDFMGSPRHVRRVAVALGEVGETLQMLARLVEADHSGRPPLPQELPDAMRQMLYVAHDLAIQDQAPRPLLMGRHLLEMNMPPGPKMGEILKAAFEAQLEGKFDSVEGAREWVQKHYLG
ncbi:MAG: multifunctional CCA protein [Nitrospirales bacterium]|nr:MAG: multifunctional CCA protein [Nitrospirales bacterium]